MGSVKGLNIYIKGFLEKESFYLRFEGCLDV